MLKDIVSQILAAVILLAVAYYILRRAKLDFLKPLQAALPSAEKLLSDTKTVISEGPRFVADTIFRGRGSLDKGYVSQDQAREMSRAALQRRRTRGVKLSPSF